MSDLKHLADLDLSALVHAHGPYTPSPTAWEDLVLYFMMVDRFSDNNETGYRGVNGDPVTSGSTTLYVSSDNGNAVKTEEEARVWREAGNLWCGGNLKGVASKLGYLKRMGVSAIWLSPLFKQVDVFETYHGYGIQNFLDIDPRFGSKEELKDLVQQAHALGIYVILDIIFNHA